jgi:hypothetical protein
MIDLAIGLAGLCMVICSPIALTVHRGVNRMLVGKAFVLGLILIGGTLGTILYPEQRLLDPSAQARATLDSAGRRLEMAKLQTPESGTQRRADSTSHTLISVGIKPDLLWYTH